MKRVSLLGRTLAVVAVLWVVALPIAPLLAARASSSAARAFASLVYLAGAVVCHQKPERSFQLAGLPLPVCARCVGLYAGAALGAIALAARAMRQRFAPNPLGQPSSARYRRALVWAVAPTLATVVWEWAVGVMPAHLIRASAGAPAGAVAVWIVISVTRAQPQSE